MGFTVYLKDLIANCGYSDTKDVRKYLQEEHSMNIAVSLIKKIKESLKTN